MRIKDTVLEFKKNGFDVKVYTELDENPDTSYLGEYTDKLEDGVIVREGDKPGEFYEDLTEEEIENIPRRGREFRGFKPYAGGEKVGSKDYKKYGLQDYKRMEELSAGDWNYIGIIAVASREGIELGHASVWGFESDGGQAWLEEEAKNIGEDALSEAKKNLKKLQAEVV
jgi:hypothetical protein